MKKLLVANRSEIAVRIFRSATELNLRTVAIYAEEDRFGVHRFKADEAYLVGKGKGPVAAYLDIDSIIALAKDKGVDMIHPGYGFLSENPNFARACDEAGITFVGPRPGLIESMGDKVAAKKAADKAGVPTLPATPKAVSSPAEAVKWGKKIGFPLIIKAEAIAAPAKPPISVCDEEDGIPYHHVSKFQKIAAIKPEKITGKVIKSL